MNPSEADYVRGTYRNSISWFMRRVKKANPPIIIDSTTYVQNKTAVSDSPPPDYTGCFFCG